MQMYLNVMIGARLEGNRIKRASVTENVLTFKTKLHSENLL